MNTGIRKTKEGKSQNKSQQIITLPETSKIPGTCDISGRNIN